MDKITHVAADGTSTDYFSQAYTDAAVAAALSNHVPTADPEAQELDIVMTDGTIKKFVPAPTA